MPNWSDVLQEITEVQKGEGGRAAVDIVRRKYLAELHAETGRNVIAYYSGWLSKPGISGSDINDEDKNGFMMAVHRLDKRKGLDLMIHTPGGGVAATQSLVDYLHQMFGNDIRAIVPQLAMSAGTMLACSCREILMGKHSNLGPIDPHLRDIPAYGVIQEFRRAIREVTKDPNKAIVWREIIGQYRPTFLGQCETVIKWSNGFVRDQLRSVMFEGEDEADAKARKIVRFLAASRAPHSTHYHYKDCKDIGLNVTLIEEGGDRLQDLILTVHHCFMHTLMNTNSFKIIENQKGTAFVKQQRAVALPAMLVAPDA